MIRKLLSIRSSRNGTSKGDTLQQQHHNKLNQIDNRESAVYVCEYQSGSDFYMSIHSKLDDIPHFIYVGGEPAPPQIFKQTSNQKLLSVDLAAANSSNGSNGNGSNGNLSNSLPSNLTAPASTSTSSQLSVSSNGATTNSTQSNSTTNSPKMDRSSRKSSLNSSNGDLKTAALSKSSNSTPKLFYNRNLIKLILDFNQISKIPNTIVLFPNLIELSLSSNLLTDLPECLVELKFLQTLHLGLNPFPSIPKVIFQIKSLTALHYESNNLSFIPQEILQLTNLNTVSLVGNKFDTTPDFLPVGLDKLNLAGNDIVSIITNSVFMTVMTTLTLLNLGENRLTKLDESLVLLTNLKTLMLDCNMITILPGNIVKGWKSLETLSCPHNDLTTLPPEIAFLPNLRVIDVRGNRFQHTKSVSPEISSINTFRLLDFISDKETYELLKVTHELNNNLLELELQSQQALKNIENNNNNNSTDESNNSNVNNVKTEELKEKEVEKRNLNLDKGPRPIILWQSTHPDKIIDGVYLGCRECSINKQYLRDNNITHILTVAHFKPLYLNLFKYKVVNIEDVDYEDIGVYFKEMNEFIDDAVNNGGAVLIHCRAGVSRSASATIAYIMYKHNVSYEEAYMITEKGRPRICPNNGFRQQLKDFELVLKNNNKQKTNI